MGDLGSISSWVDPLEEGMATHSIILTWRIPMDKALANYSPWGYRESDTTEVTYYLSTRLGRIWLFFSIRIGTIII